MKEKALLFTILILTISACDNYTTDELLNAPEKVTIDGDDYVLDAFLWRDFMLPQDETYLRGYLSVVRADSSQFPEHLDFNTAWIIKDRTNIWRTNELTPVEDEFYNYKLSKKFEGGPEWEPGIYVDVVVKIVNRDTGEEYLLKKTGVLINRVE